MATFTETIRLVIDTQVDKATTALGNFRKSVAEASTVSGKFKAGWSSALDGVSANAGALAMTVGPALVAFGLKAANAFAETSKAALDLSTSTGLSVEQASRWVAVGDDFEVTTEALATGLGKIAKTLDDTKWSDYGIATRDAAGNARDVNDILLDTFDMLSSVTNETERARIGQELFGKGYQSLTPILGSTRAEYEKMLSSVEEGQVITSAEAAKGEKWRLAMDNLSDAFADVALSLGEVVTEAAPALTALAAVVSKAGELAGETFGEDISDDIGKFVKAAEGGLVAGEDLVDLFNSKVEGEGAFGTLSFAASNLGDRAGWLAGQWQTMGDAVRDVAATDMDAARAALVELSMQLGSEFGDNIGLTKERLTALAQELGFTVTETGGFIDIIGEVGAATNDTRSSIDDMTGSLDLVRDALDAGREAAEKQAQALEDLAETQRAYADGSLDLKGKVDAAEDAQADLNEMLRSGTASLEDIDDASRNAASRMIDAAAAAVELGGAGKSAAAKNGELVTSLYATAMSMAPDSPLRKYLLDYIADLNKIPAKKSTVVSIVGGGNGLNVNGVNWYADGTPSAKAGLAVVGEDGPELINFRGGESVTPAGDTARMLAGAGSVGGSPGGGVVVNVNVQGANPQAVIDAIDKAVKDGTARRWMAS